MPLDAFVRAFDGWKVLPVEVGGEVVAAVLIRGDEIHAASIAPGKWITRRLVRESIGEILREHGKCTTTVMRDNQAGEAFVKRLGFVKTQDGDVMRYELRNARHA
jgi:hypothetical protein